MTCLPLPAAHLRVSSPTLPARSPCTPSSARPSDSNCPVEPQVWADRRPTAGVERPSPRPKPGTKSTRSVCTGPPWATLTSQASGVQGWPGPVEGADARQGWRDPVPRDTGRRGTEAGKRERKEGGRWKGNKVKSKGRAESRAGRGAPGAARGTGHTHHFLNDRLGLGRLQLLLHLLFH